MIEGLMVKLFFILLIMGSIDLTFLIWLNWKKSKEDFDYEKTGYKQIKEVREAEFVDVIVEEEEILEFEPQGEKTASDL